MNYQALIAARHSVRKFEDTPVRREILDTLVEDASLAPSAKNTKSTGFMIIQDASLLEAISHMRDFGSAFVAGAKAAIVVLGDPGKTDAWVENASISATYLMLSATDRGLGSCWVQVRERYQDKNAPEKGTAEDYLRELLGIRDDLKVLCVIALGYPQK